MGRSAKLNALAVQRLTKKGRYGDGGGLYLQVAGNGTKSWLFRYTLNGKAREMGLGSFASVSLAEAREKSLAQRKVTQSGIDPIESRATEQNRKSIDAVKTSTFADCAAAYINIHKNGWRNAKHVSQWENTIETYANPVIGKLPVQSIDTDLVMKVLEPIWKTKNETAQRLRGRIKKILDWATARKLRQGENPARWDGSLEILLGRPPKPHKHHPAMPFNKVGAFVRDIRELGTTGARALEFLILTAARTGEVLGAKLTEIDFQERIWTIPPERMKGGLEHCVPLSPRCMEILEEMRSRSDGPIVFPGRMAASQLSNMALLEILRRKGHDFVSHGFRSSFKDWASECTNFSNEVSEMALAHKVKNKVEAAYRRGKLLDKRRDLMIAWANFCDHKDGQVINIHSRTAPIASTYR